MVQQYANGYVSKMYTKNGVEKLIRISANTNKYRLFYRYTLPV